MKDQPTLVTVDDSTGRQGAPVEGQVSPVYSGAESGLTAMKAMRGQRASRPSGEPGLNRWGYVMKAGLLVIGFAALSLCGAPGANAGVSLNTIDGHVTYKRDGAQVRSSGPIGCTRGERIAIRVSVSQAATGARARNSWKGRCTGEVQHWQVRARARGTARFANGTGRVCAVAKTRTGDRVTDARKWCQRVSVSAGF